MCEWNNGGVKVNLPDNICEGKQNRSVCIDECMVHIIKELWKHDYETLGCCGHFKNKPDIVIGEGYDDVAIKAVKEIIRLVDDREISILQWRLIKV